MEGILNAETEMRRRFSVSELEDNLEEEGLKVAQSTDLRWFTWQVQVVFKFVYFALVTLKFGLLLWS